MIGGAVVSLVYLQKWLQWELSIGSSSHSLTHFPQRQSSSPMVHTSVATVGRANWIRGGIGVEVGEEVRGEVGRCVVGGVVVGRGVVNVVGDEVGGVVAGRGTFVGCIVGDAVKRGALDSACTSTDSSENFMVGIVVGGGVFGRRVVGEGTFVGGVVGDGDGGSVVGTDVTSGGAVSRAGGDSSSATADVSIGTRGSC